MLSILLLERAEEQLHSTQRTFKYCPHLLLCLFHRKANAQKQLATSYVRSVWVYIISTLRVVGCLSCLTRHEMGKIWESEQNNRLAYVLVLYIHQYIVAMETSPTERFMHYTVTFVNEAV